MASDTASTIPPKRRGVGLRARLVAAFVAIAALTTLVATLLTSIGLHDRFDAYLEQRTDDAGRSAVAIAQQSYAEGGRWSNDALDVLAHELVLTGYDYRLIADGRTLLDTTKLDRLDLDFRRVETLPVEGPAGGASAFSSSTRSGRRAICPQTTSFGLTLTARTCLPPASQRSSRSSPG